MNPKLFTLVLLTACNPDGSFGNPDATGDGKGPPPPQCVNNTWYGGVAGLQGGGFDPTGFTINTSEMSAGNWCTTGGTVASHYSSSYDTFVMAAYARAYKAYSNSQALRFESSTKNRQLECWALNMSGSCNRGETAGDAASFVDNHLATGILEGEQAYDFIGSLMPEGQGGCNLDEQNQPIYYTTPTTRFNSSTYADLTTWFSVVLEDPNTHGSGTSYDFHHTAKVTKQNTQVTLSTLINESWAYSRPWSAVTNNGTVGVGDVARICISPVIQFPSNWPDQQWKKFHVSNGMAENNTTSWPTEIAKFRYNCVTTDPNCA